MSDKRDIAGLLASRICHDLVSPIGAIVNGTDLIREVGGGDIHDELALIGQSATRASSLLQFYRVAFGAAGDEEATLSLSALRTQARQMIASDRVGLEWQELDVAPLRRVQARLVFQLLLCARAAVGMRGRIVVGTASRPDFPLAVSMWPDGASANLNPDALRMLQSAPELSGITPRTVEFALVHDGARDLGLKLDTRPEHHGARVELCRA